MTDGCIVPPGTQWRITNRRGGHVRIADDLRLVFGVDGDSMFDWDGPPDDPQVALELWVRTGRWLTEPETLLGFVPIIWSVVSNGAALFECAPLWPGEQFEGGGFLTHFGWPTDNVTGRSLDFRKLPVTPWRDWIVEATGWTPAALTPFVHVNTLAGYQVVPTAERWWGTGWRWHK